MKEKVSPYHVEGHYRRKPHQRARVYVKGHHVKGHERKC